MEKISEFLCIIKFKNLKIIKQTYKCKYLYTRIYLELILSSIYSIPFIQYISFKKNLATFNKTRQTSDTVLRFAENLDVQA